MVDSDSESVAAIIKNNGVLMMNLAISHLPTSP